MKFIGLTLIIIGIIGLVLSIKSFIGALYDRKRN